MAGREGAAHPSGTPARTHSPGFPPPSGLGMGVRSLSSNHFEAEDALGGHCEDVTPRRSLDLPRDGMVRPGSRTDLLRRASVDQDLSASLEQWLDDLGTGGQLPHVMSSGRVERLLRERQMRREPSVGDINQDGEDYRMRGDSTCGEAGDDTASEGVMADRPPSSAPTVQRLLTVANRLPFIAQRDPAEEDGWSLRLSAGGLVSALLGIRQNYDVQWIGWPGTFVPEGPERDSLTRALEKRGCVPVWLDPKVVDLYYNGYSNNVLWPLFHYVPIPFESRLADTNSVHAQWEAYRHANKVFADTLLSVYRAGDIVWLHDYHLLLMSHFLKEVVPEMKVGWFLHTPFPSSEIYRTLPLREELLRSLLKNDLVGFHTYDYARHFVSACTRILGCEGTPEGVEDANSVTRVAAFPIGIDPQRFTQAMDTEEVKKHIRELRNRFGTRKVMLGVDRLDMIKGIPQKLLGFERFLEEHPEWRDRVLLVQIAVPTRQEVPEYQRLASQVHEIVGRINGRFGSLGSLPIHHLDRSLDFEELCALYAVTDVLLVTSLRDGMNLVCYEYVACQTTNAGVLVLSEFAGAAQSLGAGALLVNPWSVNDMCAAIEEALTMSDEERRERHRVNFEHVQTHTAQAWADTFISELNDTHVEAVLRTKRIPPQLETSDLVSALSRSGQRLILLGYNATLTCTEAPRRVKQQFGQIHAGSRVRSGVMACLKKLSELPDTALCIFSGSKRSKLEEVFAELPSAWLVAENGVFMRVPRAEPDGQPGEWVSNIEASNLDWLESVQTVFDYFAERTPRSFVEMRETSLVWNYKYADPDFGRLQARDLIQHMITGPISNTAVDVVQGAKSVEVRPIGVSKGAAVERIIKSIKRTKGTPDRPADFVMCIGHFLGRDEDLFQYLESTFGESLGGQPEAPTEANRAGMWPPTRDFSSSSLYSGYGSASVSDKMEESAALFTCTVGRKASKARYFVNDSDEVAELLLAACDKLEGGSHWRPATKTDSALSFEASD